MCYGIAGRNGSGKSTLLKILSAYVSPTEGKISYKYSGAEIRKEEIFDKFNLCAPYSFPPQDFKVSELLDFHFYFKPLVENSKSDFLEVTDLKNHKNKSLRDLSSGMQQRLKLGLALMTKAEVVLLDEPTSNLDENYKKWFVDLLSACKKDKTVVIASNEKFDLDLTSEIIDLHAYK